MATICAGCQQPIENEPIVVIYPTDVQAVVPGASLSYHQACAPIPPPPE
jgi:hypothetical protein